MKLDLCKLFGVEEGEEFKTFENGHTYRIKENVLQFFSEYDNTWYKSSLYINDINDCEIIKIPKKKKFTDDELNIFRLIPKEYEWCARDKSKTLFLYKNKPIKDNPFIGIWIDSEADNSLNLKALSHLFQSIAYEDEEPLYIPDYVERNKGDE